MLDWRDSGFGHYQRSVHISVGILSSQIDYASICIFGGIRESMLLSLWKPWGNGIVEYDVRTVLEVRLTILTKFLEWKEALDHPSRFLIPTIVATEFSF